MKKLNDHILTAILLLFILVFSSIPNQFGYTSETNDLAFKGIFYDPQDYAVHISMMQAGWQGDWAYQLRFTSEELHPAFIRLFYIFLGQASRWANIEVEFMFQAARWLFGLSALFVLDILFQRIFQDKTTARFAFLLSVLGAGVGWLQLILGVPLKPISPIDLWFIDAYFLFSISLFPSFSFTLTLMAGALYLFFDFLDNGGTQKVVWICLLAVIGQLFNPIAFAVVDVAMLGSVLFTWWDREKFLPKHGYALVMIAFAQIPLLTYNLFILMGDPIWSQFTLQNKTLSPPPIYYLWGFAPFWVFAVVGMIKSIRKRDPIFGAMTVWVVSGFAFAYLPVLIQRRFLLGITIPLGALAIYGLQSLINKLPKSFSSLKRRENLFMFTHLLIASISSIFLILNASLYVLARPDNLFYPRDLKAAAEWLNRNALPNEFVLADVGTSQILAQLTPLKVYVGHEMETLYFDDKENDMRAYFNGAVSSEWLLGTPIQWVIYGPYEHEINPLFLPDAHLKLIYQNKTLKIYKVRP